MKIEEINENIKKIETKLLDNKIKLEEAKAIIFLTKAETIAEELGKKKATEKDKDHYINQDKNIIQIKENINKNKIELDYQKRLYEILLQ